MDEVGPSSVCTANERGTPIFLHPPESLPPCRRHGQGTDLHTSPCSVSVQIQHLGRTVDAVVASAASTPATNSSREPFRMVTSGLGVFPHPAALIRS